MGKATGIGWTTSTFNPWWGCTEVSPACLNCYARMLVARFGVKWGVGMPRRFFGDNHWAEPLRWNKQQSTLLHAWELATREFTADDEQELLQRGFIKPAPWRVFCASMADVFDNEVDQVHRERLWALIRATPALTWQLLTKRIGNANAMLPDDFTPERYPNVWIGMTVVTQEEFDRDIYKLATVPARVRWLSIEPQLEQIWLTEGFRLRAIDWAVTGGESGAHARGYDLAWPRSIVWQCRDAGAAPFVKQMGARVRVPRDDAIPFAMKGSWTADSAGAPYGLAKPFDRAGADPMEWPEDLRVQEFPA